MRKLIATAVALLVGLCCLALYTWLHATDLSTVIRKGTAWEIHTYLNKHPADVDATFVGEDDHHRLGVTPLMLACRADNADVVVALLTRGARSSTLDSRGWDAFEHAADCGSSDSLAALLDHGATPANPAAAIIVGAGRLRNDVFDRLIQHYDRMAPSSGDRATVYDHALHNAARGNIAANVQTLFARGATGVRASHPGGWGLLHAAASIGNAEIVQLLMERGEAVNALDAHGRTPLALASWSGHSATVRLLLDHGADPAVHGANSPNALVLAAMNGHADVVKSLLVRCPPSVLEEPRDDGSTALVLAAWMGDAATVETLLRAGANVEARNRKGRTALDYAHERTDSKAASIVAALKRHKAR